MPLTEIDSRSASALRAPFNLRVFPQIFGIFAVVSLIAAAAKPQEGSGTEKTLTLLTEAIPEHPFSYQRISRDDSGNTKIEIAGIDVDLMEGFAKELGRELVVKNYPSFDEMFAALERGDGDVVAAGLAITRSRSKRGVPSDPYHRGTALIVGRKDRPYESLESLGTATVSVLKGSVFQEALENEVPTAKLVLNDLLLENLVAVREGRADFTVMGIRDVEHYLSSLPELHKDLDVKGTLGDALRIAAFFSFSRQELVPRFNDFLRRLDESGELQRIKDRHFKQEE